MADKMNHHINWINAYWHKTFIISAMLFILTTSFEPYPLSWLLKIIPISLLILYVSHQNQSVVPAIFIIGLFFSMLGDFILDFDRQAGFLYGLGAFFVAHLFYIASLGKWSIKPQSILVGLVVLSYGGFVSYLIFPQLGKLQIPVIAYMTILFIMTLSTLFCYRSNPWLVLGGISFLISDSIIGLNKFYHTIPFSAVMIMSSYYFAQYALVRGFTGDCVNSINQRNT
jgi:alkenylglycerophosphocholine/alkenylglycerophosphoethanolamine hydrolase